MNKAKLKEWWETMLFFTEEIDELKQRFPSMKGMCSRYEKMMDEVYTMYKKAK